MIRDNLSAVIARIGEISRKSGRPVPPRLVGVTKKRPVSDILELVSAGLVHLAENRWDEWSEKRESLGTVTPVPVSWHFIGALQGRSLRRFYHPVFRIDSLDTMDHARIISRLAQESEYVQDVLVEVNVTGLYGRSGILPDGLTRFLDEISLLPSIRARGLMVMGPLPDPADPERTMKERSRVFESARKLWIRMRGQYASLEELSMGMSEDFGEAIAMGATEVRIGRLLFEGIG